MPPPSSLVRLVAASVVGTAIEFYDFFLYATAAALVSNKDFFPTSNPLTGIFLAFLTYAVGFLVRPIGGMVFGHIGDRHGRRLALVLTLSLGGTATFCMGLLPTFFQVGVLAPVLLTLLRLIQGFALGIAQHSIAVFGHRCRRPAVRWATCCQPLFLPCFR